MQKLAVLGWHKWGFQLIHVTPPPPGISGRTVPDVVMPQAAQQRARMSSGRQLEVPPFVDAGSLGALLKVASNWWSRQVAGGPVARGCRLEDAGIWRSHRSRIQAAGGHSSRMQAVGGLAARGCRQLEVPTLVDPDNWRSHRSWIQTAGGSAARESNWASPPVPCPSPFVRKHGLHGRNLQTQTWRSDHGGQARSANLSREMECTLAPDSKSSSLTPLPHM
eukprot:gene22697-biopygen22258